MAGTEMWCSRLFLGPAFPHRVFRGTVEYIYADDQVIRAGQRSGAEKPGAILTRVQFPLWLWSKARITKNAVYSQSSVGADTRRIYINRVQENSSVHVNAHIIIRASARMHAQPHRHTRIVSRNIALSTHAHVTRQTIGKSKNAGQASCKPHKTREPIC